VAFSLDHKTIGNLATDGSARRDTSGVKPVAVFRFLSEDWSSWVALLRMRERWPELWFKLLPSYLCYGARKRKQRM
jgi:hypothetical protein